MFRVGLLSIALFATPAAAQPAPAPDWMSGYWLSCEDDEQVAESWIGAGSTTLLGVNHTRNARGVRFEFLRIAPSAAGYSYFAQPSGRPPTEFPLKETGGQRVVFENPAHDFPQRILYWREGDVLTARVEGVIGGRGESMQWRFRRAEQDSRCS